MTASASRTRHATLTFLAMALLAACGGSSGPTASAAAVPTTGPTSTALAAPSSTPAATDLATTPPTPTPTEAGTGTCVPAPAGMVAWWRAEDDAKDSAGSNDGSLKGGATYAQGMVGRAFAFSGAAQYVEVPNGPALQLRSSLTLEGWVYVAVAPGSYAGIAGTWDDATGANRSYLFWALNGALDFVISKDGGSYLRASDPTQLPIAKWTHVAGTYDGSKIRIYVDGAQVGEAAMTGDIAVNARPFTIGRTDGGSVGANYWNGSIDELTVYSRALSSAEIAAIDAAGGAGKCPG